jgi:hypothetical protein
MTLREIDSPWAIFHIIAATTRQRTGKNGITVSHKIPCSANIYRLCRVLISQHHFGNSGVLEGIKRRAFVLLAERVAIRFNQLEQDVLDGLFANCPVGTTDSW